MNKLNKFQKYTTGAAIGMCLEYLHRVEFLIYPLGISICLIVIMTSDIIDTKT